jgi:phosphopantothenoylcysteine decarboxylase / phosphopantothenate---cysteine ligase
MLKGKKIIIGITGSIAAYKIPFLVRLLVREGAEVKVVMTPAAVDFVTPLTLSTLSRDNVIVKPFEAAGTWNNHVELGTWADLAIFAPVTANTLGKMVNGIADNFLVTAYLSARCPVFIAPAMDLDMYNHPSTQKNIGILRSYGNTIIEPQVGELASGLSGPGRMEEPENILIEVIAFFQRSQTLAGKKILITAGPTFEKIDPVRYIGNFSSGLMGFAIAEEAAERGADVTLVAGPVSLTANHPHITRIDVTSADEMAKACLTCFPATDITVMVAAVADYTVEKPSRSKIKKSGKNLSLELVPSTDILKTLGGKKKKNQYLAGFALESENEMANAKEKLKSKNLDLIVLNSLNEKEGGMAKPLNRITLIGKNGKIVKGELKSKKEVAADLWDFILQTIHR